MRQNFPFWTLFGNTAVEVVLIFTLPVRARAILGVLYSGSGLHVNEYLVVRYLAREQQGRQPEARRTKRPRLIGRELRRRPTLDESHMHPASPLALFITLPIQIEYFTKRSLE